MRRLWGKADISPLENIGYWSLRHSSSESRHQILHGAYASGTKAATLRPPSIPEILNLPTGPAASHVPAMCRLPPAVPEPLTITSATNDRSAPQTSEPFIVTSLAKTQLVSVVV